MFTGMIVAIVTPFTKNGEVDFRALSNHIEWLIENGVDGIVACGTTGEAPTLSEEEFLEVVKTTLKTSHGRVPIFAGTGTNDTRKTVEQTKKVKNCGVDGALVIVPYYNCPSPEGCFQHFQEVAKCDLPIIVYHHPTRTGVKLSAGTLAEILSISNIGALKEGPGDIELVRELVGLTNKPILSGDDRTILPFMQNGGTGIISVLGNLVPKELKEIVKNAAVQNFELAVNLQSRFENLTKSLFIETNPQGIKFALSLLGWCEPKMRLPLVEPRGSTKQAIVAELVWAGLIPKKRDSVPLQFDILLKEDPLPL